MAGEAADGCDFRKQYIVRADLGLVLHIADSYEAIAYYLVYRCQQHIGDDLTDMDAQDIQDGLALNCVKS